MATRSGPYQAWSNFTFISDQGHVREVDLLVAVPTGLYLIEIKYFRGLLTNHNATWVLHGEHSTRSFDNPLPLADQKAKELKGLLTQAAAKERGDRPPFLRGGVPRHPRSIVAAGTWTVTLTSRSRPAISEP